MPAGYELGPTLNDALTTREPGKVAALRQHQLLYALGEDRLALGEVRSFFFFGFGALCNSHNILSFLAYKADICWTATIFQMM